jgi:predicted transcriptional regulator
MQIQELHEYQNTNHPVLALDCDTPLKDAITYMEARDYGSVICTKEGAYHGIFTARLLLKKLAANENIANLTLSDVVRTDGPVARLEDDAQGKLEEMHKQHVHYMPVLNEKNECVGMLSQGDFAAYTLSQAGTRFAEALKNKAEGHTNPPIMAIVMGLYAVVTLIAIAVIFY